ASFSRCSRCLCRPSSPTPFPIVPRRPPPSTLFPYTTLFRSPRRSAVTQQAATGLSFRRALSACHAALPRDLSRHPPRRRSARDRSEEHTSELQSRFDLVCRLLLEKKKINKKTYTYNNTKLIS